MLAIVLGVVLSTPRGAGAQTDGFGDVWRWTVFTTESGLPSGAVNDVVRDTDGRYWVATEVGLAWFDGFVWHPMGAERGALERPVSYLAPDRAGGVLAVIHNQLVWGDTAGFRAVPVRLDRRVLDSAAAPRVTEQAVVAAVAVTPEALLLLVGGSAAGDRRVLVRVRDGEQAVLDAPVPLDFRSQLLASRDGTVFLASAGEVYRWEAGSWRVVQRVAPSPAAGISGLAVDERGNGIAFVQDPEELRGLVSWNADGRLERLDREGANPIVSLDVAPSGGALVVYGTGHIRVRVNGEWRNAEHMPPQMRELPRFVRYTAEGDLWAGSDQGLFLYRASSMRWAGWEYPFPDLRNRVNAILVREDGSVWTGTGDGLVIHRPDRTQPTSIRQVLGVRLGTVTGVAEDGQGFVWVTSGASFAGAFRFDGHEWRHFGPDDGLAAPRVHRVRIDRSGRPWFLGLGGPRNLTDGPGAFVLRDGRFERWGTAEGLPSGRVYDFAEEQDGTRWFVTLSGISRWQDGVWTHWDRFRSALPGGRSVSVPLRVRGAAAGADRAWFADRRMGVMFVGEDGELHLTKELGIGPEEDAWDVAVDPAGELWASTSHGVCVYHEEEWSCVGPAVGLATSVWPVVPRGNQVYIGTQGRGLQVLSRSESRAPLPHVLLENPVVEDRTALVRWSAHAYMGSVPSEVLRTRYRVDGRPWSPWSTAREVTLENLGSGGHTFQVQAMGLFGDYAWEGGHATFRVLPPLLARPEFAIPLGGLIVALIVVGLTALRHRRAAVVALKESEERFRTLGDAAFEGIGFSRNGAVIDVNERLAQMLGYERDEMLGRPVADFVAPQSRELVSDMLQGSGPTAYEHVAVRKDGTTFPVEVQGRSISYQGSETRATAVRDITDRVKAQEALRASEEKFAKAFWTSPDAIDIATLHDGKFVEVNDAFLRLYERSRREVIGKSGAELDLWVDEGERETYWAELREHGRVERYECRLRDKAGGVRHSIVSAERLELGGVPCVLAVTRDVTEQKRVLEALRITQFAVDHAADAVFWIDRTGRVRYANDAASESLGYSRDALEALWLFDFNTEITRQTWPAFWSRLKENRNSMIVTRHRARDGRTFPVEVLGNYVDVEGREFAVAFARDITERVENERAIVASEEKFSKAFRSTPNAIAIARASDGRVIEANDGFLKLWGYERQEVVGKTTVELGVWVTADDRARFQEQMRREGRVAGEMYRTRRKDGEERILMLWSEPIELQGESCFLSVGQDVTDRVRAQEALEESQRDLRTLSRRLMEAQEAERARIARELHDEIGQALAVVKLNLQAIARLTKDERINTQVSDGISVVDQTVDEVRNLSRDLRPSVLDDLGLAAALKWYTTRQAERAGIEIVCNCEALRTRPRREVETACYRIVQEALTNVVRHAKATHVDVDFHMNETTLTLLVRDNGAGFDVQEAEESDDREGHLGLIGMRERAQNVGGTLSIDSQVGSGTIVEARFGLHDMTAATMADRREAGVSLS